MNYIFADLNSTCTYIEEFAKLHQEAPAFYFGTLEDVMSASRGDENFHYPCLWLDLPTVITEDNEANNLMERYRFNITVFYGGDLDDRHSRAIAYQKAIQMLQHFQKKLRHDNHNGVIMCELSGMQKSPLNPQLFNASHYGYILYFEAAFHANNLLC